MRLVEGKPLASGHIGLIRGTQYLWQSVKSRACVILQGLPNLAGVHNRVQNKLESTAACAFQEAMGRSSKLKQRDGRARFVPKQQASRDAPVLLKVSSCATQQWDHHRERISVRQKHGWLVLCSRPLSQKEKIRHTFPRIDKNSPEVRFVTARRYGSCVIGTFNC